ncbi:replication restart helicase PriA [Tenuifilum sp.]|uniref:replication restart helicase PriA n=1 Tax=Tenuifilum sp. TaxID=2760880 RepID=UPI002C93DD22|nr:primosomal protein N' [Tenuifilum sp.]
MTSQLYADVILPLALQATYTYSVPFEMEKMIQPGVRVVVSFGQRRLYSALVYRVHSEKPQVQQVKDILQVIDTTPIVLPSQYELWEWLAEYYMCSLGEVMKAALPSGLKMESDTYIASGDFDEIDLSDEEMTLIHLLGQKRKLTIQQLTQKSGLKHPMSVIKSMLERKLLFITEDIESDYRPKTENYIALAPEYSDEKKLCELIDSLKRAPAQQRLILAIASQATTPNDLSTARVLRKTLLEKVDVSASVLKSLIDKGYIVQDEVETSRIDNANSDPATRNPLALEDFQINALNEIQNQFSSHDVVLLHGVTSSGKTELYIHLINQALQNGKQVLYLLPEIALTTQIINRLRKVFGNRVGVYHSKFSDSQRVEVYLKMLSEEPFDVILGVRSSIFLPFSNLGLVIVDEEHENTFKQYNPAPRYHARDTAIVLAKQVGAKVLLGTATPAVETYFNAKSGKFGLVKMLERFSGLELPRTIVVDTRDTRKRKRMKSHFSDTLLSAIENALSQKEQVILFQNRRGYAPFIECADCGWVPHCEHCDVTLTYHKYTNQLTCHYCGFGMEQMGSCLACGSTNLQPKGFGTEKVEDELSVFFPDAVIERIDLDSTRSRSSYERIISGFEQGKIDILVGTQMVSKGLDFDRVSLVGILNADNMLNFPDFRAFERSFQLITQVSGRAGRKGKQGLVIIQTAQPDHPVIKSVTGNNFFTFWEWQLAERNRFHYPPFYRLVRITLKHKDKHHLEDTAENLAKTLRHSLGENVLGPEPPIISRVQGLYILEILVKIKREQPLQRIKEFIRYSITMLKQKRETSTVVIAIDVDPY